MPKQLSTSLRDSSNHRQLGLTLVLVLFFSSLLILCLLWPFFALCPPDRVKIAVTNLPPDTHFASIVAESEGVLRNMDWSVPSPFVISFPNRMHPADCTWSLQDSRHPPRIDWDAYVSWEWGTRYGVVTMSRGGVWKVTWFASEEIPLRGRVLLLGGGRAGFDLAGRASEPLPAAEVRQLGLQNVKVPE